MFEIENQVTDEIQGQEPQMRPAQQPEEVQAQPETQPIEAGTETAQKNQKTYTQEEVDTIVKSRLGRQAAKIQKENDRKYGRLTEVLKAGTGKENVEEIADAFAGFYQQKGVKLPQKSPYSSRDLEVLAEADAQEIISGGFEEVVEEVDRLARLGSAKMSDRDKLVFRRLAEYRQQEERGNALTKIGASKDLAKSKEFTDFAAKFSPKTPITEIYDLFEKTRPKKEIHTAGTMKQGRDTGVKDYYTPEEIEMLTEEDLTNPKVWEAVRRSMTGG